MAFNVRIWKTGRRNRLESQTCVWQKMAVCSWEICKDYFCKTWGTGGKEKEYTHVNGLILLEETLKFLALINTGSDIY